MSISPFSVRTATEIVFGRGEAGKAPERILAIGQRVLLVHGAGSSRADPLAEALIAKGAFLSRLSVAGEPDLTLMEQMTAQARAFKPDVVVGYGGGSAIDAAKAVAALVPATRPILDHLEVVGKGLPLEVAPLPFVALPTTAGTGAEVTRNAVIGVPEHRRKVSLRDPAMLARLAIIDPALTDGAPKALTLATGLDAITQVIEPYLSSRANPFTDALCESAIPAGLRALVTLMQGEDSEARDRMAFVSLSGGLALANAGLGVVHGLAGPLGGLSPAPHGALCGALLVPSLKANRAAIGDPRMRARVRAIEGWIGAALSVAPDDAFDALSRYLASSGLKTLSGLGVDPVDHGAAADAALVSSSMKANPVALDRAVLLGILASADD